MLTSHPVPRQDPRLLWTSDMSLTDSESEGESGRTQSLIEGRIVVLPDPVSLTDPKLDFPGL